MCYCPEGYHEAFAEVQELDKAHPELKIEETVRKCTNILFDRIQELGREVWQEKEKHRVQVSSNG